MSERDDESEDGTSNESRPISAVAPIIRSQEEAQVEVASSPAFQCLEEVFDAGKITGTRMANLKAKYTTAHEFLKETRKSENRLLHDAKRLTVEFEKQKLELEKADLFPDNVDSEVGKLRQDLLKRNNEMLRIEEKEYEQNYKMEALQEEFCFLQNEYEQIPKADELEVKKRDLEVQCEQLKKENAQRNIELRNLKEDLDAKTRQNTIDKREIELKCEEMEVLQNTLAQIHGIPTQIAKEIDKLNKQKVESGKRHAEVNATYKTVDAELKAVDGKLFKLRNEKKEVEDELDRRRSYLEGKHREYEKLSRDFEFERERETVLMGDRASLDMSLRHTFLEKKACRDLLTRRQREKDRELRQLRRLDQQWKVATDGLNHLRSIYQKFKDQSEMFPRDEDFYEKRRHVQMEVDDAKRKLAQQNTMTSVEQMKVEDCILEEEKLIKEQEEIRSAVVDLTRLGQIKVDEREQKARDLVRAEQRLQRAVQDLKTKEHAITDLKKKFAGVQLQLQDSAKFYDIIKNERNKCVNQIQASKQKFAEMKEKFKILANEIEILRNTVVTIESNLQKERLKNINSLVLRDSLRNERLKSMKLEEELKERRDQLKIQISKLNLLNNQAEQNMIRLRKRYENAVRLRNERGVQLIEREEEVCIFYEKFNIQEKMIKDGDETVQEMDDNIRYLKLQQADEQRYINLGRKNNPSLRHLHDELVTLQIQLSQCQDRMCDLEKELEDPDKPGRVRLLKGLDPDPVELQMMIGNLETRLAEKEENLLERVLVFEQATRITERINNKVSIGKDDAVDLAKTVNRYQYRIKRVTRRMMSIVSELAMKQAETMRLQLRSRTMNEELQQSQTRWEQGDAPSYEIANEWEKMMREKDKKRIKDAETLMDEQEEKHYQLPGGGTTTAEPRPNAYIPDEKSDLPIPRPYGALAPFKPTETGSSMRHIKKPVLKPIEI